MQSTISFKGQVVIPIKLRKKYNLRKGSRVMLVDYGGVLALVPAMQQPIESAHGILKGKPSLLHALKEQKKREHK
ncbi:MAG TPA: AbrB/MazE/SpoVT family DNA-binding domain-containing protein [Anaerolineae bacterium]|nr:AbrB/MazE/SpoVT family DNA-binding domain-containing protein [Anaerolineae bacterium]